MSENSMLSVFDLRVLNIYYNKGGRGRKALSPEELRENSGYDAFDSLLAIEYLNDNGFIVLLCGSELSDEIKYRITGSGREVIRDYRKAVLS